ncbi:MAG: hypothetical protein IPJ58_16620 [Ardenticatenia bacterium]|nr:hypothetical protein [Ardenticatenia bacterium]
MSFFRHIKDARHIMPDERCGHSSQGLRCLDTAAYWLVSDDDRAIVAYCQRHADATIAEYHAAASAHPDDEELAALALWRTVPVTMAAGAA